MTANTIFKRAAFPVRTLLDQPRPRFLPGTRVATPRGPFPVELLAAGDAVLTRNGPQPVIEVETRIARRVDVVLKRDAWPVRVPVGSLGNPRPIRLGPRQMVVLEGPVVASQCDAARIVVAVEELVGLRGLMSERPVADLRWMGLRLEAPALVRVEGAVCALGAVEDAAVVPRETARAVFAAMDAVGEPRLAEF